MDSISPLYLKLLLRSCSIKFPRQIPCLPPENPFLEQVLPSGPQGAQDRRYGAVRRKDSEGPGAARQDQTAVREEELSGIMIGNGIVGGYTRP